MCGSTSILQASEGGVLTSPNYPNDYDNGIACSWIIVADEGNDVLIDFHSFHTYSGSDFLYVSDPFLEKV